MIAAEPWTEIKCRSLATPTEDPQMLATRVARFESTFAKVPDRKSVV